MRPVAVGVLAGSLLALWGGRLVRGLLYEAPVIGIGTLAAGALSVTVVSWLAAVLPTVRASRVQLSGTLSE